MPWYAKDCHYLDDPKIMRLGDRFGAAGPLVVDRLMARAKLLGQGGRIECVYRSLASECFVGGAEEVREIVAAAADLLILTELEEDGFSFVASFPRGTWDRWQANFRQQQKRERERLDSGEVTASHEPSREVTNRTGQDRTTQDPPPEAERSYPLSELLASLIAENGSKRPSIGKSWRDAERLMVDRDGRDPAEAAALIRWCQHDEFWRSVILSMPNFRAKYDQLRLKAKAAGRPLPAAAVSVPSFDAAAAAEAEERWVKARLGQIPEHTREDIKPLGVRDGVLYLSAPPRCRGWVDRRYRSLIEKETGCTIEVAA